ncbi:sugar lactone lactonase YvrE [Tamaricihabitans halophyticus]|uniref:Sugar lactone lactonase YvrE n=1 Tax=Tamaricihabitans halophyticus TaxID=1262583 RepID=A0A4R2QE25_9PSEU|nr:SMP-30/gluconolactonase/LRE family protein [Tamaricihabitans halophyticus]TCP47322.1 sugar lactone lactonase YvrE [Tamaricihabitans halophyticus]
MKWYARDKMRRLVVIAAVSAVSMGGLAATAAPGAEREWLDIQVFAEVPEPGHPEGITVAEDGTTYVGTQQHITEPRNGPSKIFAYSPEGALIDEYVIEGQDPDHGAGIVGLAQDGDGVIYALDRYPQRVIALDPKTGEQWDYASFEQVKDLCIGLPALVLATQCVVPDGLAFGPDDALYVTDVGQGLIWRVPPGGGKAEVWFTDPRIESIFGANGIGFVDEDTLMFAQTLNGPLDGVPPRPDASRLYTIDLQEDGSAGELETFWQSKPADGIDGFAIAESGNIYVALALANAVTVVSPEGKEIGRNPANAVENLLLDVPMDDPASVAFNGDRVLVTNHTLFLGNPASFAVHDVYAGERGKPEYRPRFR